ncbi:Conserved_hypothetical protein [Hexamita inflata]|uniref:Transmembrane protein n=1 Tax=Hexamita inflata TaxID=28002 RepID=A0AA86Q9C1_9EUKA|nr:Conserved hypothetical protein [Hexamita inflata]
MLLTYALQLNCFATNASIVVVVQSNSLILNMYPLDDNSTEQQLCKQLNTLTFQATVLFGVSNYSLGSVSTYSTTTPLSLTFACQDGCAAALAATSASYSFFFSQANVNIQDTISSFQIERYNRVSCIANPTISFDSVNNVLIIHGTDNGCKLPYISAKSVQVILSAYPDIILYKSLSLAGITNLQQVLDNLVIDCMNDYTDTEQRSCQRLIEQFTSQSNYAELTLQFPGLVPDNSTVSTYVRDSPFSIYTEISTMSDNFVNQFDCFTSQTIVMLKDTIRIDAPINTSQVHCLQPIKTFIGNYDESRIVIQIQDNPDFRLSKTVQFTYANSIFDFNTVYLYLSCKNELEGYQKCISKLEQARSMTSWTSFIERKFYNNGNVVQAFQTLASSRIARIEYNAVVNISKTQLCVSIGAWTSTKQTIQVQLQLFAGFPKYSLIGHSTILDIKGQISYPTSFDIQPYCMQIDLSNDELLAYEILKDSQDVTGIFHFMNAQCSADTVYFADELVYVNYVGLTSGISVIIALIWFSVALAKELK